MLVNTVQTVSSKWGIVTYIFVVVFIRPEFALLVDMPEKIASESAAGIMSGHKNTGLILNKI